MTKMAACVTILYRGGTIASLFSSTVVSLTCDYPPELFPVGRLHDEIASQPRGVRNGKPTDYPAHYPTRACCRVRGHSWRSLGLHRSPQV
jgi:hypothetical protein